MKATEVLKAQHRTILGLFSELNEESSSKRRSHLLARISEELIAHMAAEEAVFYPAVRKHMRGRSRSESAEAHMLLRLQLRRVLATPLDDDTLDAKIRVLQLQFEKHAGEEDVGLFATVERSMRAADLELLGQEIINSRPPVWVVTPEPSRALGPSTGWALRSRVSLPIPADR